MVHKMSILKSELLQIGPQILSNNAINICKWWYCIYYKMKHWWEYYLAKHKRKLFGWNKYWQFWLNYVGLNLWLHKWCNRYGNWSTSVEYSLISAFCLAEYLLYWWGCSFLANSVCICSKFVSHHSVYVEGGTLITKLTLMVRELWFVISI